ncbi:MAG: AraC family transcriptional regulator [Anaerocolumna sp.]
MKPIDSGLSTASAIYFHTASPQAQKMFFCLICTGHYYCDSNYSVSRNKYDSYLIMLIKRGHGSVTIDQNTIPFSAGQAVLIDCYKPHSYKAHGDMETLWIHFYGNTSREYCNYIVSQSGNVITLKDTYSFENKLNKIYTSFQSNNKIGEAFLSQYITNLLTLLITFTNEAKPGYSHYEIIEDTISFICDNISRNISLTELSSRVSLSPYYFTRLFKKETGFTPHGYIISARTNAAKFYLKSSHYPVKEICFSCGFTSESNFCTSFKKVVGMTPSEYRESFADLTV